MMEDGAEMAASMAGNEGPAFSEEEKEILGLYDEAQGLELEIALVRTRIRLAEEAGQREHAGIRDMEDEGADDPDQLEKARAQLLEAMALYNLRNRVVNNVLLANPLLQGIYNSTYASPIEQDILPWMQARDATSHSVAKQSAAFRKALDELTQVESECLRTCKKNRELAAEALRLAKKAEYDKSEAISYDLLAKEKVKKLEQKLAASKQKWRVMKGTASGIVAGSGVDWAGDAELREVVLDPEA